MNSLLYRLDAFGETGEFIARWIIDFDFACQLEKVALLNS